MLGGGCGIDIFDEKTIKALKQCLTGLKTIETTNEYVLDQQTNDMVLVKRKVNEKTIPPNVDLLKLVYNKLVDEVDYNKLTDEQLEQEKQKLIQQLKEEDFDSSNS